MKLRRSVLAAWAVIAGLAAARPLPPPPQLTQTRVWNLQGPVPPALQPIRDGFVHTFDTEGDGKSGLVVLDMKEPATRLIGIQPLPDVKAVALRHAAQRSDGSFIVSARWVERGVPRTGLLYVDAGGVISKKSVSGWSVGRLAITGNGWVAATLQPARKYDAVGAEQVNPYLWGYFHEDSGEIAETNTLGISLDKRSWDEQNRDLLVRCVSPLPNGYVAWRPGRATAYRDELPRHSASTYGGKAFPVGGMSATFEPPERGPFEVIAIAPFQTGDEAPQYIVGWGRKRPVPLGAGLRPSEKYGDMLLALYDEGRAQKPIARLDVQEELWDVVSDGRRVFAVLGEAPAHVDEIAVKLPD